VAPGARRTRVFIEGPSTRPDPCLVFNDSGNLSLPPTCTVRVAADALDSFPGHAGGRRTSFFPVAARNGLSFLINDEPLFSLNDPDARHEIENYGVLSDATARPRV